MSFSAVPAATQLASRQRASATVTPRYCRFYGARQCPGLWAVAIAISLLTNLACAIAHAEIIIEPHIGFHGVFQLGRPFPLELELSNSGRPAEGTLDVRVWKGGVVKGGAPYPVSYRREIFLPSQGRKTVQLTIDPDFVSRPLSIAFTAPEARGTRELDLRRYFSPSPVLLFMSGSGTLPTLTSVAALQNRLVAITADELPADSRALLGVSHVIFYEQSLRDLSRSQLLALDGWLTAGGRMVIMGSVNYALYQEPALARFLPVRVTGVKQVAFTPTAGKSQPGLALSGVWAQTSNLLDGQVVSETGGTPMIVEAHRGRGRIVYLALDVGRPPLSEWRGLQNFLQSLITPSPGDEIIPRTEWSDAVFNQLIASPSFISTYVPSGSLLFATVSYLAAIGVLTWLWQRRRLAGRSMLLGLAMIAVVATVAGYAHFSRGGNVPDGVLLSSSVLENSGDDFVDVQANLALFSTQLRHYDLELERGWIDLTPVSIRPSEAAEQTVVTQEGGGVSRYELPLREWDYRLFRMRRIDRLPLRASVDVQEERVVLKVENRSANDLVDCWLLLPGQRFAIGAIRRGANWQNTFPLLSTNLGDAAVSRGDALSLREITFADKTRDILFHSSMFPRDGDPRWAGGAAVFFGWVKDSQPHVRIDDARIQAQDYTLYRAVFPLTSGEDE